MLNNDSNSLLSVTNRLITLHNLKLINADLKYDYYLLMEQFLSGSFKYKSAIFAVAFAIVIGT